MVLWPGWRDYDNDGAPGHPWQPGCVTPGMTAGIAARACQEVYRNDDGVFTGISASLTDMSPRLCGLGRL